MTTKIILFEKDSSWIAKAIAHVTGSRFTHSAVYHNGIIYHSSERVGKFDSMDTKEYEDRSVEVFHVGASPSQVTEWIIENTHKRYDWKGVIGWILYWAFGKYFESRRANSRGRVYCHECVANLINKVQGPRVKFPVHISGDDLKNKLNKPMFAGNLKGFLSNVD